MRNKTLIILSLVALTQAAWGANDACHVLGAHVGNTYNGLTSCSNVTTDSLTVNGPSHLSNVHVKTDLLVHGPMSGSNVQVNGNVEIDGPSHVSQLKVSGTTTIKGPLSISQNSRLQGMVTVNGPVSFVDSSIGKNNQNALLVHGPIHMNNVLVNGDMQYYADESTLINSHLKNITDSATEKCPQKLYLKQGTVVNGNITFASKCGEVYIGKNVKINGQVIGGKKLTN